MKRVYSRVTRRIAPAETRRDRLQDAIDVRSRRKLVLPYGAVAKTGVAWRFGKDGARLAHRRRDHAIPAALVAGAATLLRGADLPMRGTWFSDLVPYGRLIWLTPRWWWTPLAAAAVAAAHLHLPQLAEKADEIGRDRLEHHAWARFFSYCNLSPRPLGLYIKPRPHSTTYVLKPKPSTTDVQVYGMRDDLARGFEAPAGVTIDKQKATALWEVTVWECDLLATDPVWRGDLPVTPDRVPLGVNVHGHPIFIKLLRRNALVGGTPDAGKSSSLKSLVAHIARIHPSRRRLHFADPQNGLAFMEFEHIAASYAETGPTIKEQVRTLLRIMDERGAQMRAARTDLVPISPTWPWHVFVVDEVADVTAATDDEFEEDFTRLMREGRKAGISVILCTQSFRATIIPPAWKELILVRIGFRVASNTNTKMIMDTVAADGVDLTSIPADQPGRGWYTSGDEYLPFRAYRLHGASTPSVQEVAAAIAPPLAQTAPPPTPQPGVPPAEIGVPPGDAPIQTDVSDDFSMLAPMAFDLSNEDAVVQAIVDSGTVPIRSEAIAEIVGCSVRTAQRWAEKTGMVPRRLPDGRQGWVHPTKVSSR